MCCIRSDGTGCGASSYLDYQQSTGWNRTFPIVTYDSTGKETGLQYMQSQVPMLCCELAGGGFSTSTLSSFSSAQCPHSTIS